MGRTVFLGAGWGDYRPVFFETRRADHKPVFLEAGWGDHKPVFIGAGQRDHRPGDHMPGRPILLGSSASCGLLLMEGGHVLVRAPGHKHSAVTPCSTPAPDIRPFCVPLLHSYSKGSYALAAGSLACN